MQNLNAKEIESVSGGLSLGDALGIGSALFPVGSLGSIGVIGSHQMTTSTALYLADQKYNDGNNDPFDLLRAHMKSAIEG